MVLIWNYNDEDNDDVTATETLGKMGDALEDDAEATKEHVKDFVEAGKDGLMNAKDKVVNSFSDNKQ